MILLDRRPIAEKGMRYPRSGYARGGGSVAEGQGYAGGPEGEGGGHVIVSCEIPRTRTLSINTTKKLLDYLIESGRLLTYGF